LLDSLLILLAPPVLGAQANIFTRPTAPARSTAFGRAFPLSKAASAELDRLYTSSKQYASSFRKITCQEHIHSEQNSAPGGFNPRQVHWKMDTVSDFTVDRVTDGVAGFKDHRTYRLQDGKPVPDGRSVVPPYVLHDAFGPALLSYLSPEHRACLQFTLHATRIDFATQPGRGAQGACVDIPRDAHGFVTYDPQTKTISHIERTVPLEASLAGGFAPFASIDYQADGFDGNLYMIPYKIVASKTQNGLQFSFEGTYKACKLFQPCSTIYDMEGHPLPGSCPGKQ
jgi:hypothetical protein